MVSKHVALLKQTLPLDPQNAFTLNNLGVASEATGDFDGALRYYLLRRLQLLRTGGGNADHAWRGRSVSEMAAASAKRLERRIRNAGPAEAQAVMLTIRGVFESTRTTGMLHAKTSLGHIHLIQPVHSLSIIAAM